MDIIPVLDIRHGQVVQAKRGDRASYAPIVTSLAGSSDPVDVARGLLRLHPFPRFYIADLDAIEGRDRNDAVLARLRTACPETELWVDNGLAEEVAIREWRDYGLGRLVFGSESQADPALPHRLGGPLSLDFREDAFLGPRELLEQPGLWPHEIIVMTLGRVGSGLGPDLDRLSAILSRAPQARIHAAGGVRGPDDLDALARIGAAGALVASALHDGRIPADAIARFADR